jgi:hypothetical protein
VRGIPLEKQIDFYGMDQGQRDELGAILAMVCRAFRAHTDKAFIDSLNERPVWVAQKFQEIAKKMEEQGDE